MKKTLKYILPACPFLVLLLLFITATFYDLQISKIFADVKFNFYYSENIFARFFEIVGESPVYFLSGFSFAVFSVYFSKINKINTKKYYFNVFLIILFYFFTILLNFFAFYKLFNYICKLNNFNHEIYFCFYHLTFAFLLTAFIIKSLEKFNIQTMKKLCLFSLITLTNILITNIIVQSLKPVFARMRYRAMTYLNQTDFNGYTPWYVITHNTLNDYYRSLGLTSDIFKSFPSGHTAAATSVLSLISLNFLFPNIKKHNKILINIFCCLYVIIVGISRLVMGAHFLSDIVFSIIVGYGSFLLSNYIFEKLIKHKKQNQ